MNQVERNSENKQDSNIQNDNLKSQTSHNILKLIQNKQIKLLCLISILFLLSILGYQMFNEQLLKREIVYQSQLNKSLLLNEESIQLNGKRFLNIEDIAEEKIEGQKNTDNKEQQEISKAWEYFYIVRQYLLILLLWIIIKFFDNALIKKDGKFYLNIEFIMFCEGIAFGFLACFGILSFVGFVLSFAFTYNLKESVEFANRLDSLYTTLFLWIYSFIFIGYFSLTNPKKRGIKEKIVLTLVIIPNVLLVFVLPAQGMIILMN